jgi:hypothetical protein
MQKTTTYDQLMRILDDGDWHSAEELTAVAHFPHYWIDELRHEGHQVVTDAVGRPVIRLREAATAGR